MDFRPFASAFERVQFCDFAMTPVTMNHSKLTYGYLIEYEDQCLDYLTDTVGLPDDTLEFLQGIDLNYLVLDCSSPPQQTLLTHISHEMDEWLIDNPVKVQGFDVARDQLQLVL